MAKKLETVAAMACMTILLMLFNLIFIASGLLILFVGIYTRIELQNFAALGGASGNGAALLSISCLGALITLVGVLACCCTTRQHPALLYLYGGFLAVVALLELAAGATMYSYRTTLIEGFDRGLNKTLAAYGTDKIKNFHVDTMQSTLHCCGNRAYTDWLNMTHIKVIPSSCCSVQLGECDIGSPEDLYTEGCYNRVINFVQGNVGLVAAGACGIAFFPIAGIILSCCLASYINKVNYEQIA